MNLMKIVKSWLAVSGTHSAESTAVDYGKVFL